MCDKYPDWKPGVTPNTNPNAKVVKCRRVTGASVIKVAGGKYRMACLMVYLS